MKKSLILGAEINTIKWIEAIRTISEWSKNKESRYVCICNVHSVVTAYLDKNFAPVINQADLATPDGAPIAWALRQIGHRGQERINGPDLMLKYCSHAENTGESIFLYGGTQETLDALQSVLSKKFPKLRVAGAYSPPFRKLTSTEEDQIISMINSSGAGTVWVSLGCPKQENWMAHHRGKIQAVMIGVGAAFDYHAGTIIRAPDWMQRFGLEWMHRLCAEPKRLWRRYLVTNTIFIALILKSIINGRLNRSALKTDQ